MSHPFSKAELERYSRHLIIPEFNIEGQRKLKEAKVLVVGSGGLGSPLLLYFFLIYASWAFFIIRVRISILISATLLASVYFYFLQGIADFYFAIYYFKKFF